jgi:hypothetical protein
MELGMLEGGVQEPPSAPGPPIWPMPPELPLPPLLPVPIGLPPELLPGPLPDSVALLQPKKQAAVVAAVRIDSVKSLY